MQLETTTLERGSPDSVQELTSQPQQATSASCGSLVIKNARIVLADEMIHGSLKIEHGRIAAIDAGNTQTPGALDINGDTIIAGLVELHTDNLERHMMPRPKTSFPLQPALLAHDSEVISAGITTVFDALGVGDPYSEGFRDSNQQQILDLLDSLASHGVLRADHFVHARCELPAPNARALFEPFVSHPKLRMISLMDHTPGQRQWTDVEHARAYYTGKKGWTDARFDHEIFEAPARQARYARTNRNYFKEYAVHAGLTLASHDDTTEEHVRQAHADRVSISEFPTTLEAAREAKALNLLTVAGAPNIVRGGSHSGNVAAIELARHGLLDILSSDYVPTSLINAVWELVRGAELTLPLALKTVTTTPARAARLYDRGEIKVGLRADLVRIREVGDMPAVSDVWVQGRRVH